MSNQDVSGLGIDIVEIDRMVKILERTPRFKTRFFSEEEQAYCDKKARPEVHYALRFAAKEAVLKALGIGFAGVKVTDVEVVNEPSGKPTVVLHGSAAQIAEEQGVREIPISLSYTHTMAVANAVAITDERRPRPPEKVDPRAELEAAFKEAKALIQEMDIQVNEAGGDEE